MGSSGCSPDVGEGGYHVSLTQGKEDSHYLPHHNRIMALMYHLVAAPSVIIVSAMSSGSTNAESYLEQNVIGWLMNCLYIN